VGRLQRSYALANAFELMLAVLAITAAVGFLVWPETVAQSPIGKALHPFDYIWTLGYGAAGVLITIGLLGIRPRLELAGLSLLAAAVSINAVALWSVVGLHVGVIAFINYLAIVLACVVRAAVILRSSRAR
jgi:hypothetical protein